MEPKEIIGWINPESVNSNRISRECIYDEPANCWKPFPTVTVPNPYKIQEVEKLPNLNKVREVVKVPNRFKNQKEKKVTNFYKIREDQKVPNTYQMAVGNPPAWYICEMCYEPGHFIRHCPMALMQKDQKTPYQGPKRSCGEYKCPKCKRVWFSVSSFANTSQKCNKCRIDSYPHKQFCYDVMVTIYKCWMNSIEKNDFVMTSEQVKMYNRMKYFFKHDKSANFGNFNLVKSPSY